MKWKKKIHVKSSLPKKENQYALFCGRFQPLHVGHKKLFEQVLSAGDKVLICIRDIEPDENNPYTALEVKANIEENYAAEIHQNQVKVMLIPDFFSVNFGRGVGYDIIEYIPPKNISKISATKIREKMKENGNL